MPEGSHSDFICPRCVNRNNRRPWDILIQTKAKIIEFVWAPNTNSGVRLAALKFMQRVILVQSRGINDPRVRLSKQTLPSFANAALFVVAK